MQSCGAYPKKPRSGLAPQIAAKQLAAKNFCTILANHIHYKKHTHHAHTAPYDTSLATVRQGYTNEVILS